MAVFTTLFIASMALKGLGAILGEKAKDKQAKEDKKQANKAYSRDMRDIGLTAYTDRRQTARQYKDAAIASARSTSTTQSQAAVGNVGGNSVANIVQQFMAEGATNEMVIRENEVKRSYSCHDTPLGTLDGGFELFKAPQECITYSCVSSADSKIPKRKI